jgi:hypothetical protein
MGTHFGRFSVVGSILGFVTLMMSSETALAQRGSDNAAAAALGGVFLLFMLAITAACYVYFALAIQTIADKTGTPNSWLAWIPIANIFLMLGIAKKPMWWFILCLIPLVNIVMAVIIWMAIAEARQKPNWWGILSIVPIANLIVPGYLAWAD